MQRNSAEQLHFSNEEEIKVVKIEEIDPKISPEMKKQVEDRKKEQNPKSTVIEPIEFRRKPEEEKE